MLERIEALEAAVRQISAWLRAGPEHEGHKFGDPPPAAPPAAEDPEKAQAAVDAAEAEVKAQQEHGALMVKWAQDNAAKAKAILEASQRAAQQATRQTQQQEQAAERGGRR
ncbi:MAG TPA: hypothetical protein VF764_05415 [Steroidobacteraceae bacterium]